MRALLHAYRWPLLISSVLFALLLLDSLGAIGLPAVQTLAQRYYDARMRIHQPGLPDMQTRTGAVADIVIVDIDEKTLATEGQWPWPRQRVATLIDQLFGYYQVRQAGLDIAFAEPDSHNPLPLLQSLGQTAFKDQPGYQQTLSKLAPSLDPDRHLAQSLRGRNVILGFYLTNESNRQFGQLPPPSLTADLLSPYTLSQMPAFTGFGANLADFQKAASGAGHFNPYTDPDGLIRRIPLLQRIGDDLYESLALRMYRQLKGNPALVPVSQQSLGGYDAVESLLIDDYQVPVDSALNALIPYRGPAGTFRYVSASDVLHKKLPATLLKGKIVLVGTSAVGLADLRNTPVGNVYPGVEIHANLLAGLIDQQIPSRPAYASGIETLLLAVLMAGLTVALMRSKAITATGLTLGMILGLILLNDWLWTHYLLDIPVIRSLMLLFGLFVIFMTHGFFSESQLKRQLANRFGQYVPPEIVEKMYEAPEAYSTEGQARELTVMFCDVRNFTNLSAHLTPQQLASLMQLLLTTLTEVVRERHWGTIDKYIGDCIMAFWGAPMADPLHAKHALDAALEMQAAIVRLRPQLAEMGLPPLSIGIGINTGTMVVGEMGSRYRTAYTVMGDAVNLAARLESLTKYYGVSTLVGHATADATQQDYLYRPIDRVIVKGRDEATDLFEPVCPRQAASAALIAEVDAFAEVVRHYQQGDFATALKQLTALKQRSPDNALYLGYEQRLHHFISQPPADWDGITRMDAK